MHGSKDAQLPELAYVFASLILSVSLFMSVGIVIADNANFTLEPQETHAIALNLQGTDTVSGSFSVVSNDETGINFYVTDPQNKTILKYDDVGQRSFSFTAEAIGTYQLRFDNSVSSVQRKTVSVNFNITHYIMGIPQEQFLFLVIAAAALIGILAYAILMPK